MKLTVISHKLCWPSNASPSGYATDGGFSFQIEALSELFDSTALVVPIGVGKGSSGEVPLCGRKLTIVPLSSTQRYKQWGKLSILLWLLLNFRSLIKQVVQSDAIHAPVPGSVGTIGMVLAFLFRKPLFVRHCGNWLVQETLTERFLKWFMERFADGRNVMLATGQHDDPPSSRNPSVRWIFSTIISEQDLQFYRQRQRPDSREISKLIIVCRQTKAKGTGIVIQSLATLLPEFPYLSLDVIGDGPDLAEFKRLAGQLGLNRNVRFHGQLKHPEVIDLLQQADLLCYPTMSSEGFSKSVLEALACGLPVIASSTSSLPYVISSDCGIILETISPAALANAIRGLLLAPEKYSRMSEQATVVAQQYSIERWQAILQDSLGTAWGPLQSS